jgi:heavy metal sensor kinase
MPKTWSGLSIRTRLTFFYCGALLATLIGYSFLVYLVVSHSLLANIDKQLEDDFEAAAESLNFDEEGSLTLTTRKFLNDMSFHGDKRWLEVWNDDMKARLYPAADQIPDQMHDLPLLSPSVCQNRLAVPLTAEALGEKFRFYCAPFSLGNKHVVIRVGRSQHSMESELLQILGIMVVLLPLAAMAAGVGAYFLVNKTLVPLDKMGARAATITAERLDDRLPVANANDELGRLATVFNNMLERLDQSFQSVQRFTSDASHELRTPLAAMVSVGEVALRRDLDIPKYRATIESMLEEARRMSHLVGSLLTLSRADARELRLDPKLHDVRNFVQEVVGSLMPVLNAKRTEVCVDGGEVLHACFDKVTITQALRNLLDNAVKYNRDYAPIHVRAYAKGKVVTIEVEDKGLGIPKESHPFIFERFYRVDKARSRDSGGVGLGLSIVKWLVHANNGEVEFDSSVGGGSRFRIRLPLSPESKV